MTMQAVWNGAVLAESDDTVVVEHNHYFPVSSLNREFFEESEKTTVCSWKGTAQYFSVTVDGRTNADAAWFYADPSVKASMVAGRVAFWKGVDVRRVG